MGKNDTLLVLPTLNELKNLEILVPQIIKSCQDLDILVIDDGSSDGSQVYLQSLASNFSSVQFINRGNKLGIGSAHLCGLSYAIERSYKYVVTMDADQTHRVADLATLLETRTSFGSMVIGSRYLSGGGVAGWSLFRNILTRAGHLVTFLFFFSSLDMSSGMRLYKTSEIPLELLQREAPVNYDFFFVSVLIYKKLGLRITQIPILLDPRGYGSSKMSISLMSQGILRLFKIGLRASRIDTRIN
jgi:dolichol-phosphate mannosyltransferase